MPFANYPRLLRARVRLKEFRACQITSDPLRYFLNFEDAFYYHVFMKTILRLMGVYEKGKRNALKLKTTNIAFYFSDLPAAFENYTILFLSDLHLDGLDGLTERLQASGAKAPRGPLHLRRRSQDGPSRTVYRSAGPIPPPASGNSSQRWHDRASWGITIAWR